MSTASGARSPHPIVFLVLCTPFGATTGYVIVTLGYLLSHAGVSVAGVSALVAISLVPQTWKALWAPIVDTMLTSKRWYFMAALATSASIVAVGLIPANAAGLTAITALVFVNSVAVTFIAMSAENLMAHATRDDEKGRAGGWYQAGNLGGSGIGGGLALWIAEHSSIGWLPGATMGALFMACCLALLFIDEPKAEHRAQRYIETLGNVGRDLWNTARSRAGYLALLICFLPIGAGAASNLWSAVSGDWHASADAVALVNGVLGGIVSAVGCVIGGYVCDRMDRKLAYLLFGIVLAIVTLIMAVMARTEAMFVVFTLAYALVQGFNYASFSAVVLEAIGRGAAATKYNVYASLSNIPILYGALVDGWAHDHWGSNGFLGADAMMGLVGVAIFLAFSSVTARLVRAPA